MSPLHISDLPPRASIQPFREQENLPEKMDGTKESMMEDSSQRARHDSMLPASERSDIEHAGPPLSSSGEESVQYPSPRRPSCSPLSPAVIPDRAAPASSPLSAAGMASRGIGTALHGAVQNPRYTKHPDTPTPAESTIPTTTSSKPNGSEILRAPASAALRASAPPPIPLPNTHNDTLRHHSLPPTMLSRPTTTPQPAPTHQPSSTPGTFTRPYLATLFTKPHPAHQQQPSLALPSGPRFPRISNFSLRPSSHRPRRRRAVEVVRCGSCDDRVRAEERLQLVRCDVRGCGSWWHLDCVGMVEQPGRRVAWECPGCRGLEWEEEEEEGEDGDGVVEEGREEDGDGEWAGSKKRKLR
ncbi:zinc ion binding [Teratosphaeria destructans]|uniref:Zinc ion binding n=1 Tax=Teratosphaeria destructans TaxID=418781 RepID=A0A9W7STW1_9PEZI|nr:zinc ion binding [Teratosphaeria destructans]